MGKILSTLWRTESEELVILLELELKAFIVSEIPVLQQYFLALIEMGGNWLV